MAGTKDYYKALELTRSASTAEIHSAYRRLSLTWHPERCTEPMAASKFYEISEAFDVLGNAARRAVYDQYGHVGLSGGAPIANTKSFTDPYTFHGDVAQLFRAFFGTDNPYQAAIVPSDELGVDPGHGQQTRRKQDPAVVEDLLVTLEEVYSGCTKKMRISRRTLNSDGHTTTVQDKILTIAVKPGWAEGTRVVFANEGDQGPNVIPADIVFRLKYKPHPVFSREGDHLVHTATIQLADALTGSILELPTLDGRKLNIPLNEIVCPGYEKVVLGEGMPSTKEHGAKGNLILRFNIVFPTALSEEKRRQVRVALAAA